MSFVVTRYNKYALRAFFVGAAIGAMHFPQIKEFIDYNQEYISNTSVLLRWFFNPYVLAAVFSIGVGRITSKFGKIIDVYNFSEHDWSNPRIDTPQTLLLNKRYTPKDNSERSWNMYKNFDIEEHKDQEKFYFTMREYFNKRKFFPIPIEQNSSFEKLIKKNYFVEEHVLLGNSLRRFYSPTIDTIVKAYEST